jgi:type I restriction enzyme M protein
MENFDSKLRNALQDTMIALNKETFINADESFSIGFYFLIIYKLGFFNKKENGESMIQSIDEWKESEKVNFQFAFDRIERQIEKLQSTTTSEIKSIFHKLGEFNPNQYSSSIFKDIYEEFYSISGSKKGTFTIPISIAKVISSLVELGGDSSVFSPFAGSGSLTIALKSTYKVICVDQNHHNVEMHNLRKAAWERNNNYFIMYGDSINHFNPSKKQFDLIVSMPPVIRKLENLSPHLTHFRTFSELVISSTLNALNSSGQAILILPVSFLYTEGKDKETRELLLNNDLIDTIISLPAGIIENTLARFCILYINKSKSKSGVIRMVDGGQYKLEGSKKFAELNIDKLCFDLDSKLSIDHKIKYTSLNQILEQSNNLSPSIYLIPSYDKSNSQHYQLNSILSLVPDKSYDLEDLMKTVNIQDLRDDAFNFELKANNLETNYAQYKYSLVTEDCILIALKGSSLKPTYFKYENTPILVSPEISCFQLKTELVNIQYLIYILHSDLVHQQVTGLRKGSINANLKLGDLLNIFIELPNLDEQTRTISLILEKEKGDAGIVAKLRNDNKKLEEQLFAQSAFLRHALAGRLSNARAATRTIKSFIDQKILPSMPNIYSEKLKPSHEHSFGYWLGVLKRDLKYITEIIETPAPVLEMLSAPLEKILIADFIKSYCNELRNNEEKEFEIEIDIDDSLIIDEEGQLREVFIMATPRMLTTLLDNIIENAEKHAFVDDEEKRIEFFLMYHTDEENYVDLQIGNSGKPLPKDFDHTMYYTMGGTYGKQSGTGYGGWLIGQISSKICDFFEIIDEVNGIYKIKIANLSTSISMTFKTVD